MRKQAEGAEHPSVAATSTELASVLMQQGRYAEAEPYLTEALAIYRAAYADDHPSTAEVLVGLGRLYLTQGRPTEAEAQAREALRIRRAMLPDAHWQIAEAESVLGASLAAQARYAAAEPLLTQSYQALHDVNGANHESTQRALERLVAFYTAWEKPAQAAEYRALLVR